jgi:hypothetical protein
MHNAAAALAAASCCIVCVPPRLARGARVERLPHSVLQMQQADAKRTVTGSHDVMHTRTSQCCASPTSCAVLPEKAVHKSSQLCKRQ